MGILKKIWYWLSMDVTKGFQKSDENFMLKGKTKEYISGGYIGNNVNYVAPEEFYKVKGIRREGTKIKGGVNSPPTTPRPNFSPPPQNPTRDFKREADDNFMLGAIVGCVIVDSLNEDNSHKVIEAEHIEPVYLFGNSEGGNNGGHSSSSDSDYIPSSSSSYDSGSYSSSYDSGSSSSCSCDSGC